ncbi:Diaminopimelate epimerase [Candidatus Annandia adelgestsuga]|uniref:Diaminopimelate epimerase n=1 Tax=Candidatus Annandia adelgestsuga TaxID=1302411 RepID=A0A3S9J7D1_9ENTR|nr:diaminopimelate epimerase [Candidatus Annandia adelgestsuga]AZP36186.1 Diaminopimelate epimerase [Candidatus Annandia adelgestsuga]
MKFSKMHGLGNDFVIVNNIKEKIKFTKLLISNLSNRYLGIGFDQLLSIELPYNKNYDFHYRIFNSNGNEVTQCGNGARCLAFFLKLKKITNKNKIKIKTNNKKMILYIKDNNNIKVNMGKPKFYLNDIPFFKSFLKNNIIKLKKIKIKFDVLSIGNPHCIIQVNNLDKINVNFLGSIINKSIYFPNGVNVSFVKIIKFNHIKMRVYERDLGETKSCGSAACASVAIGIKKKLLSNKKVKVDLKGGSLYIKWKGLKNNLYMIGPATHVYDGFINI